MMNGKYGYSTFGNEAENVYCVSYNNKLFKTEMTEDLNKEIDRIVDLFYYAQKKRLFKRMYIFKLQNVDLDCVQLGPLMEYKKNLTHIEVVLKKSQVKVFGDQKLANQTIYLNKIVSDIVTTRSNLLKMRKYQIKQQYRDMNLDVPLVPVTKEIMVNRIMKHRELPRILKRN